MKIDLVISDEVVKCFAEATAKIILNSVNAGEIQGTPPAALPALITEKQAAALLNVSLSTIRAHSRIGALTKHKIGKAVRYDPDEVRNLAKQKKATKGRPNQ